MSEFTRPTRPGMPSDTRRRPTRPLRRCLLHTGSVVTAFALVLFCSSTDARTGPDADHIRLHAAPGGTAANEGTAADPLSLEAAWARAMEAITADPGEADSTPVRIILADGVYELEETLVHRVPASARPLHVVAAPKARPVVSGGKRLPADWQVERINGRDAWTQVLPQVADGQWYFRQLWVNGSRASVPALPKEGYFQIEDLVIAEELRGTPEAWAQAPRDQFIHRPGDYDPDAHAVEDQWFMINYSWFQQYATVRDYDPRSRIVLIDRPAARWLLVAHPAHGNYVNEDHPHGHDPDTFYKPAFYRLHNVFEALDSPGEFYLDRTSGKLHYVPRRGEDPFTAVVTAPYLHQILVVRGRPGHPVGNLVFDGITFSHSKLLPGEHWGTGNSPSSSPDGTIHLTHARDITFRNCAFHQLGEYALSLAHGSQDINVIGNSFEDLATGALKTIGDYPLRPHEYLPELFENRAAILAKEDPEEFAAAIPNALPTPGTTMRIRVTDNTVYQPNRFFRHYVSLAFTRSRNTVVAYNRVRDTYFNAIKVNSSAQAMDFAAVDTWIAHNCIRDVGQGRPSANDMGGINLGGYALGSVVEYNRIGNVRSFMYGGNGIYVDAAASCHYILRNNIIWNCDYNGIHVKGHSHVIENNIVYNSERAFSQMTRFFGPEIPFAHLERNILVSRSPNVFVSRTLEPEDWTFRSRNNLLWSSSAGPRVHVSTFGEFGLRDPIRLRLHFWRERFGLDEGSVIAPVAFVDARAGDFRLMPETRERAEALGFEPFDTQAGPRPADERTEIPFKPDNHSVLSPAFREQVTLIFRDIEENGIERRLPRQRAAPDPTHIE